MSFLDLSQLVEEHQALFYQYEALVACISVDSEVIIIDEEMEDKSVELSEHTTIPRDQTIVHEAQNGDDEEYWALDDIVDTDLDNEEWMLKTSNLGLDEDGSDDVDFLQLPDGHIGIDPPMRSVISMKLAEREEGQKNLRHTTAGIRQWSPT
ncbi:hypothetical protein BS50DRAFT_673371 [Corynespora cassiicola Philippines]|uniref:Uncharacterized protein n=1 Tax=Corynespora cassiicola Philippines TaxID=1448308 RepID=A0A2T2P4Q3_CORCC|nr:hypothetical protein BS50DRAFT_673371 [Corynespora cassiicola Philippines]